jgi:hypothetical protein
VESTIFEFSVREAQGKVRVNYGVNDDPQRWGYHLLGLAFDINTAFGFPVIEAAVEYDAEGYAAFFGWIQVVRYWTDDPNQPVVIVDVAPQMSGSGMPYLSFGIEPVLFDAPAIVARDATWRAWSFLTFAPDCVMTPVIEPACGFRWGYDVCAGSPTPTALLPAGRGEWLDVRTVLDERFPAFTFGGDDWQPW